MPRKYSCLVCYRELTLPASHHCTTECQTGVHHDFCPRCITTLILFWETGQKFVRLKSEEEDSA
jgi:hypothetical protein